MISDDPFIDELLRVAKQNMRGTHSAVAAPLMVAGGWCAPSSPIYDDWNFSDVAHGLLDLPQVSVRRGAFPWPIARTRPLPKFEDCPSFGPPLGMLKPLDLGLFIS